MISNVTFLLATVNISIYILKRMVTCNLQFFVVEHHGDSFQENKKGFVEFKENKVKENGDTVHCMFNQ